jgi:hypothetical protein
MVTIVSDRENDVWVLNATQFWEVAVEDISIFLLSLVI